MNEKGQRPRNVRELLIEAKDVSDLIIDLAHASVLYGDSELAEQVRNLEDRMDELMYQIRALIGVSVRSFEDAERTTGLLQISSAIETISNAAGDLANLVLREMDIHKAVKEALTEAERKISKIKIGNDAGVTGQSLKDLSLPPLPPIRILAIEREGSWTVGPKEDDRIEEGDILLVRGSRDGIEKFCYMVEAPERDWNVSRKYKRLRKYLSKMRDSACYLVDMALYSVLFKSEEVAEEVRELEQKFDEFNYEAWREVLKAAKREKDVMELNSALQAVKSLESISDAADSIADVILRGVELHPVFAQALEDADEQIASITVGKDSSIAGHKFGELELWRRMGVYVLALGKSTQLIPHPSTDTTVNPGDKLILKGPTEKIKETVKVIEGKKKWPHLE